MKLRLIVLTEDDNNAEQRALAHCGQLAGTKVVGTKRTADGLLVKLAHDDFRAAVEYGFQVVIEGVLYPLPVVDIREISDA